MRAREPVISLARIVWHVQQRYGAAWYHAPQRWQTRDGFAPFFVVLHAYAAAHAYDAAMRLSLMRAIALAMAEPKDRAKHVLEDERVARGE
jgi:hypothetical protein